MHVTLSQGPQRDVHVLFHVVINSQFVVQPGGGGTATHNPPSPSGGPIMEEVHIRSSFRVLTTDFGFLMGGGVVVEMGTEIFIKEIVKMTFGEASIR